MTHKYENWIIALGICDCCENEVTEVCGECTETICGPCHDHATCSDADEALPF